MLQQHDRATATSKTEHLLVPESSGCLRAGVCHKKIPIDGAIRVIDFS